MKIYLLGLSLLLPAAGSAQDALEINPGLWETTIQVKNPMLDLAPQTRQECIRTTLFDPQRMLGQQQDAECRISNQTLKGNRLEWSMQCGTGSGVQASGEGHAVAEDQRIRGAMIMLMDFNGQRMTTETSWDGVRLGDC